MGGQWLIWLSPRMKFALSIGDGVGVAVGAHFCVKVEMNLIRVILPQAIPVRKPALQREGMSK